MLYPLFIKKIEYLRSKIDPYLNSNTKYRLKRSRYLTIGIIMKFNISIIELRSKKFFPMAAILF